jgi:hypothetical protein
MMGETDCSGADLAVMVVLLMMNDGRLVAAGG